MSGWIAVRRDVFTHPNYSENRIFSALEAWIWLIANCEWYDRGGVCRGSLLTTQKELASEWSWSKDRVSRFLKRGADDQELEIETRSKRTLIRVVNYEKYQGVNEDREIETRSKRDRNANTCKKDYSSLTNNNHNNIYTPPEVEFKNSNSKLNKKQISEYCFLTDNELTSFLKKYDQAFLKKCCDILDDWVGKAAPMPGERPSKQFKDRKRNAYNARYTFKSWVIAEGNKQKSKQIEETRPRFQKQGTTSPQKKILNDVGLEGLIQ